MPSLAPRCHRLVLRALVVGRFADRRGRGRCLASVSLIRPCQPLPVARNDSTMCGSSRMVTTCFVGAFCGPRPRRAAWYFSLAASMAASREGWSATRTDSAKSAAVHSGLSGSVRSGSRSRIAMLPSFAPTRRSQTDQPAVAVALGIHDGMQHAVKRSERDPAVFAVPGRVPHALDEDLAGAAQADAMARDVFRVLLWMESVGHYKSIVLTIRIIVNTIKYRGLPWRR